MKKPVATLLHLVQLIVGNVFGVPEVKGFLEEKRFPLDRISEGTGLLQSAQGTIVRRDSAVGRLFAMTKALVAFFAAVSEEVSQLRFTLRTALRGRKDLLAKVGLLKRKPPEQAKPAAPTAEGQATPPTVGGTDALPEAKKKRHGPSKLARFLSSTREMIEGALGEPEVLSAIAPSGYERETLEGILSRLPEIERMDREQEAAKGAKLAATAECREAASRMRAWFSPWKRRLNGTLKGRQDLKVQAGLAQ